MQSQAMIIPLPWLNDKRLGYHEHILHFCYSITLVEFNLGSRTFVNFLTEQWFASYGRASIFLLFKYNGFWYLLPCTVMMSFFSFKTIWFFLIVISRCTWLWRQTLPVYLLKEQVHKCEGQVRPGANGNNRGKSNSRVNEADKGHIQTANVTE